MKSSPCIYVIQNDGLFSFWLSVVLEGRTRYRIHDYLGLEESLSDITEFKPMYVILKDGPKNKIDAQQAILNIKGLSPATSVIVLSDEKDAEAAIDLIRTGADNYIGLGQNAVEELIQTIH